MKVRVDAENTQTVDGEFVIQFGDSWNDIRVATGDGAINEKDNESTQQKAIEKTEQGNKEPKKKFSWKKIWAIVVSSIIILAALTTFILNLDKIKEIFRGETEKEIPSHKIVQQTMDDSPGGTQVAGDLYINETENILHKPIFFSN